MQKICFRVCWPLRWSPWSFQQQLQMSVVTLARSEIWTDEGADSTMEQWFVDIYLLFENPFDQYVSAGEEEGSGFSCHNSCVSRHEKLSKQSFLIKISPYKYIFETIKFPCTFSICSRKTRRRPRVKTKFSFMPEGQQREVTWKSKRGKTWHCSGARGLNNFSSFLGFLKASLTSNITNNLS